jgi:hypothetical protein
MLSSARVFRLVLLGAVVAAPLLAQTHPNFTGRWKQNDAGRAPGSTGPRGVVFQIEHKDPAFKYTANGFMSNGGVFSEAYELTTDGKMPPGDAKVKAVGTWDGPVLVVDYDASGKMVFRTRFSLSADGKQMTRDTVMNGKSLGVETYDRQ